MVTVLSLRDARGFTLIETVVATAVLITALAGVAQLLVMSAQWSRHAGATNAALIAAQAKIEAFRAALFTVAADGTPLTDPLLQLTPSNTLDANVEPYVDWLDQSGGTVSGVTNAAWARRWRIAAIASNPDAISIEVCVHRVYAVEAEACLATLRTRHR